MRILTFITVCLIFSFFPVTTQAEDTRSGTYIRMEEMEIIGVVEHPEITYIIPKTSIQFNRIPLQRDFQMESSQYKDPFVSRQEVKIRDLLNSPQGP